MILRSNFSRALAEFDKENHRIATLAEIAQLRIESDKGSDIQSTGVYGQEGFVSSLGKPIIIARSSYLLGPVTAALAAAANKAGNYYNAPDPQGRLYKSYEDMARADHKKTPAERRAMSLSSPGKYVISASQKPEVFEFLLGKVCQQYIKFFRLDDITLEIISQRILNGRYGVTVFTQACLAGLPKGVIYGNEFGLHASERLFYAIPVRGNRLQERIVPRVKEKPIRVNRQKKLKEERRRARGLIKEEKKIMEKEVAAARQLAEANMNARIRTRLTEMGIIPENYIK